MEIYRTDRLAALGLMLGLSQSQTGTMEALPRIAGELIDGAMRAAFKSLLDQAEQQGQKITVNYEPVGQWTGLADALVEHVRAESKEVLETALAAVDPMLLPDRWKAKLKRVLDSVDTSDTKTLMVRVQDLAQDYIEELKEPLFLYVSPGRRDAYLQTTPAFGQEVADKFPDATRDIAAASRCLALDEWTASVFHLMRVCEHGLRKFADVFGSNFIRDIELANWKNIIDQIESAIRAMEQQPKTPEKTEKIKAYSAAASQFRYFKDAWRNHVSHSREHYDAREAETVFLHVKDFMQAMTSVV